VNNLEIKKLDYIFKPKNMAIVGVSLINPLFPGNIIYNKNLFEYPVNIYPVNPKGGTLEGNIVYKNLGEIPVDLDLAVLMISAKLVPDELKKCGEFGVKSAIIGSGGFSELGSDGVKLENRLIEISKKYDDLPFMGPNCLGIHSKYCDTFILPSERLATPPSGNVAVISQSGGFLIDQIFSKFHEREIGIFSAANIGNKALINESILLKYYDREPGIDTIVIYNEGFKKNTGKEIIEFAQQSDKDIIIIKGGKSKMGAKAAMSHTASLASNINLISSSFRQAGIIEAISESELVSYTKAISFGLSPLKENKIVILSISGGHGVLAADLAAYYRLNLVEFTDEQKKEMKNKVNPVIASIGSFENPIDLTGSVNDTDIENCLELLLNFDNVEGIVILLVPYVPTISMQIGRRLGNILRTIQNNKPVVAYCPWLKIYGIIINGLELNRTIPVASTIEEAIQMMRGLYLKGLKYKKRKLSKN